MLNNIFKLASKKDFLLSKGFPEDIVDWSISINEQYSPWLCKMAKDKKVIMGEDDNKLIDTFAKFDKVKNLPQFQKKDINQYKDYGDLVRSIEPFLEQKSKRETKKINLETGINLIYKGYINDGNKKYSLDIYKITTKEASSSILRDTEWCVKDPRAFEEYGIGSYNPLFLFVIDNKKYALLNDESGQLKDVYDSPLKPDIPLNISIYNIAKEMNMINVPIKSIDLINLVQDKSKKMEDYFPDISNFIWEDFSEQEKWDYIYGICESNVSCNDMASIWLCKKVKKFVNGKGDIPNKLIQCVYDYINKNKSLPYFISYEDIDGDITSPLLDILEYELSNNKVSEETKDSLCKICETRYLVLPEFMKEWIAKELQKKDVPENILKVVKGKYIYNHVYKINDEDNGINIDNIIKNRINNGDEQFDMLFSEIIHSLGECPKPYEEKAKKILNNNPPEKWVEGIYNRLVYRHEIGEFAENWFIQNIYDQNLPEKAIDALEKIYNNYISKKIKKADLASKIAVTYYPILENIYHRR